jgi:hypothetical protein
MGEFHCSKSRAESEDAIGDVFIYMAGFCTARGIDLQHVYDSRQKYMVIRESVLLQHESAAKGKLCHSQLKLEQGIRGDKEHHDTEAAEALGLLINTLEAQLLWWPMAPSLLSCVEKTWTTVRARNWKANPQNGEVSL